MALEKTNNQLKPLNREEFLKVLARYYKHNKYEEGVIDLIETYLKSGSKKNTSATKLLKEFSKFMTTYNEPKIKLKRKKDKSQYS